MFNPRQLLGLESSCRLIAEVEDGRIRRALATNLSDLLRYQNMLCRYDTMALKSLDIFSVHGFPVGLVQCESNLLGIVNGAGANVGSGGWSNVIDKYVKAKRYCEAPFEVRRRGSRNVRIPVGGDRKNAHAWRYKVHRLRSPDPDGGLETPPPLEPRFARFREDRGFLGGGLHLRRPRAARAVCDGRRTDIAGRGFGVRREDMKKLLLATRGKVFTLQNMEQLVENTRLAEFRSR